MQLMQAKVTKMVPLNGVPAELKTFEVGDPTGQTEVTLWNLQILEVKEGQSYHLGPLAMHKIGQQTVLTGTPGTSIQEIAEVQVTPSFKMVNTNTAENVRGTVEGFQLLAKPQCCRCHFSQEAVSGAASYRK